MRSPFNIDILGVHHEGLCPERIGLEPFDLPQRLYDVINPSLDTQTVIKTVKKNLDFIPAFLNLASLDIAYNQGANP